MIVGCGATHVSLAPPLAEPAKPVRYGGSVAVSRRAEGLPETIGHGTVTVFAIPATPIRFGATDPAARIMDELRLCLTAAGYAPVTATEPPQGPVLTCTIDEMSFSNYTWLAPVVRTWGTIRLTLAIKDPSGKWLWQKQYEEDYADAGVSSSFNHAVNLTLSKILARATEDFTAADFHASCCSRQSPPEGEPASE
jgi:hypothetical protein